MRPLSERDIRSAGNGAYDDISRGSHAAERHTGASWDYLLHRLAGAMQANGPSRTLAFSSVQDESDLAQIVNTAVEKHASVLASASRQAMSMTRHDVAQARRLSDGRHDPMSETVDVDMEMDTYDPDEDPIAGYGVVRDGQTGKISAMASSQFRVVLGMKTQFDDPNDERDLGSWVTLKTVTCDLERQLADNRDKPSIARANRAMAPKVDLEGHILAIPPRIAPPPLKAAMLTAATPTVTSGLHYQRLWADEDNEWPLAQVIAIDLGRGVTLAMRFDDAHAQATSAPTFFMQSPDPQESGPVRSPERLRAIVTSVATEQAKDDVSTLFASLARTGAITRPFQRLWDPTRTLPQTLDELRSKVRQEQADLAAKTIDDRFADEAEDKTEDHAPQLP